MGRRKEDDLAALVRKNEEEDDLFPRKKQKKYERSREEIALLAENIMAELEVATEEDAELNRMSRPAITKLTKLTFLRDSLSKKYLQQELLDHGVLCALRSWLEPLPDGSLPNLTIREAILKILTEYPIDLDREDRREQLKKSGLGKVIMFLSKSEEEMKHNRLLATSLVDSWSRSIFHNTITTTRYHQTDSNAAATRQVPMDKQQKRKYQEDYDLDFACPKSEVVSTKETNFVRRPEPTSMQFVIRPPSKIVAGGEVVVKNQQQHRRLEIQKKVQRFVRGNSKRKCLQAAKLSVEGRNVVNYC